MGGNEIGNRIYDFASKLYPIFRSLSGDGVRETFSLIDEAIFQSCGRHIQLHEVPSGEKVFDWVVPKEWRIHDAYIENEQGIHIIDTKQCNISVIGYSIPVDRWVSLDELKEYIYVQEDQPDVIPYITSYYKDREYSTNLKGGIRY